jgi:hypothetical protein
MYHSYLPQLVNVVKTSSKNQSFFDGLSLSVDLTIFHIYLAMIHTPEVSLMFHQAPLKNIQGYTNDLQIVMNADSTSRMQTLNNTFEKFI